MKTVLALFTKSQHPSQLTRENNEVQRCNKDANCSPRRVVCSMNYAISHKRTRICRARIQISWQYIYIYIYMYIILYIILYIYRYCLQEQYDLIPLISGIYGFQYMDKKNRNLIHIFFCCIFPPKWNT